MEIYFVSEKVATDITNPKSSEAIISITEPGSPAKLSDKWTHVLRLQFHDIDREVSSKDGTPYVMFNKEMATSVLEFYKNLPEDIDMLVVHCHAGISRSAGVVLALCDIFNITDVYKNYPLYNKHVYKTIKSTHAEIEFSNTLDDFLDIEYHD
jgi:predicted protein tyrosine phosphatase